MLKPQSGLIMFALGMADTFSGAVAKNAKYHAEIACADDTNGRARKPLQTLTQLAATGSAAVLASMFASSPAAAADCVQDSGPIEFGIERPFTIDADCRDPGFNESNWQILSETDGNLLPPPNAQIPFREVVARFNATTNDADIIASGQYAGSATSFVHNVTIYLPPKELWQHRFFHHVYPLPQGFSSANALGNVNFALTSGGYFIDTEPGSPLAGYRMDAAVAKIAKAYASNYYQSNDRIYGYVWGGSGGSYMMQGILARTTGVWDGGVPYVIATEGLSTTSFHETGLFSMRVPLAKRQAIAAAVTPGSGLDPFATLTDDEKAGLLEYMRFGFPLRGFEGNSNQNLSTGIGFSDDRISDPSYEDDFWSQPGYEGANPPAYLAAAKVDHFATITSVTVDAQGRPTSITIDAAPTLGSTGATGLETYVYLSDGTTRVFAPSTSTTPTVPPYAGVNLAASVLTGTRTGTTITVNSSNNQAILDALVVGNKVRINNRYVLACAFHPRHAVPPLNPQYDQYRNPDGTPIYAQRSIVTDDGAAMRTTGGIRVLGQINFKTIAITNLLDVSAFAYTGEAFASMVRQTMGETTAAERFRIYYQDSADHFGNLNISDSNSRRLVSYVRVMYQALRDLSAWVEKGRNPPRSTAYTVADGQIVVAPDAAGRRGIQPVVNLRFAGGGDSITVSVNQPVTLYGHIEVPPLTGKILNYDWALGVATGSATYDPPTVLPAAKPTVDVTRTISYAAPGTYLVSLRTTAQRNGILNDATAMQNLARVRVVVTP